MRISTGSRSVEIAAREMFPLAQLGFVHSACRRQFCGGDHLFLDSLRLGGELQKKKNNNNNNNSKKTKVARESTKAWRCAMGRFRLSNGQKVKEARVSVC